MIGRRGVIKLKKLLLSLFGILFFITLVLFATYSERVKEAEAIVTPLVNICHCEQPDGEDFSQFQTLHISIPAALAHLTQHDSDHPGACLADVCDNLEGVQEDTPESYENNDGYCFVPDPEVCEENVWTCQECNDPIVNQEHRCYEPQQKFCNSNYDFEDQEVCEGEFCETIRIYDCSEYLPTPEPVPTPDPSPAAAPVCTNNVPDLDLKNPHVVRNGSDATVNSFVPEGDRVNIYFRTSGQTEWQHALRDVPVTNGYLSVTIHDLNPTGDYDFGIQASNGCAGGEIIAVIVDSWLPQVFSFTRWERL